MAANPYNRPDAIASAGSNTYNKSDVKAGRVNPYDAYGATSNDQAASDQKAIQANDNRASNLATKLTTPSYTLSKTDHVSNLNPDNFKQLNSNDQVRALQAAAKAGVIDHTTAANNVSAILGGQKSPTLSGLDQVALKVADMGSGLIKSTKDAAVTAYKSALPIPDFVGNTIKAGGNPVAGAKQTLADQLAEAKSVGQMAQSVPRGGVTLAKSVPGIPSMNYSSDAPSKNPLTNIVLGKGSLPSLQQTYRENGGGASGAGSAVVSGLGSLLAVLSVAGGGKMAYKSIKGVPDAIKNIPTTKEVNVNSTVPNPTAREFFNNPNPAIDPATSKLLTKALGDNKSQFITELRGGKGVTVQDVQTIPTVYGKLLNIIHEKMNTGVKLTKAETNVANDAVANPDKYAPPTAPSESTALTTPAETPIVPAEANVPNPARGATAPSGALFSGRSQAPVEQPPAPPLTMGSLPPLTKPDPVAPVPVVETPVDEKAVVQAQKEQAATAKPKPTGSITTYSGSPTGVASGFSSPDKQFSQQFANEDTNGNPVKGTLDTKQISHADTLDTRHPGDRAALESILGKENVDKLIESSGNGLPAHVDTGEQDALIKAAGQLGYKHIALSETDVHNKYNGRDVISYADTSPSVTKEVTQPREVPKAKGTVKPLAKKVQVTPARAKATLEPKPKAEVKPKGKVKSLAKKPEPKVGVKTKAKKAQPVTEKKAYSVLKSVIERNPTLPILKHVDFNGKDITATDLETSVVYHSDTARNSMTVDKKVVDNYGIDEAHKMATENKNLGDDHENYPEFPKIDKEVGTVSSDVIGKSLKNLISYIDPKASQPVLTGVNFAVKGGKLTATATDGYRMHSVQLGAIKMPDGDFNVPYKAVATLQKVIDLYPSSKVEIFQSKGAMRFKVGSFDITTKLIDANYPKYETVIGPDKISKSGYVVDTTGLRNIIKDVGTQSDAGVMHMKIGKGEISITYKNKADVSVTKTVPFKPQVAKLGTESSVVMPLKSDSNVGTVDINKRYLDDVLAHQGDKTLIAFDHKTPLNPILVQSPSIAPRVFPKEGKASFDGTSGGGSSKPKVTEHPLDALQAKAREFTDPQKFYDSLRPVERDVVRQNYRRRDGETELDLFKRMMESSGARITDKPTEEDYKMSHRPNENGARSHNLIESDNIPKDMYSEWYGSRGSVADGESITALKMIRDDPNAKVTIYRAAPNDSLRNGDWVTFSKTYAEQHADSNTGAGNNLSVHSFQVKASDVRWAMDDINEFGYYPSKPSFDSTSSSTPKSEPKVEPNPIKESIEAIKQAKANPIKKFIKETSQHKQITGDIEDKLHALSGQTIADNIVLSHLFKEVEKQKISSGDWEAVYHHAEDNSFALNETQKALYDNYVKPLQAEINTMRKEMGLKEFKSNEFVHRIAKQKGSSLERYLQGDTDQITAGGVLNKSTASKKTRTWMKLTDNHGNTRIVSIKSPKNKLGKALGGQQVTAFDKGKKTPMGLFKRKIPDPVTEFYDPAMMDQLNDIAKNLGLTHIRTNIPLRRGDTAAGVSYGGLKLVKTKTASPFDTLLHEIGHQIDDKYNLYDYMVNPVARETVTLKSGPNKGKVVTRAAKEDSAIVEERKTINQELRDLTDKRIYKDGGTDSYRKYIRKGEEKMAVMFQAYLHDPLQFQAVAPTAFDKFEAFLKSHADTKAITNIEKSLAKTKEITGDVRHQGEFIDKNGKKWKITNATSLEVEQNSNTRYYHNPLVTTAIDYMETLRALRAAKLLEEQIQDPGYLYKEHEDGISTGVAIKSDAKVIPKGWITTSATQFRGYHFEPNAAYMYDDFFKTAQRGDPLGAFTGMNEFLRNTIFYNPLMHIPNIFWHAVMRRGVSGLVNPVRAYRGVTSSIQAINQVIHHGDLYQEMLREGSPLMSFDRTQLSKMIGKMMDDTIKDDKSINAIAQLAGYGNKANFVKAWYKVSKTMTWGSHDFFMMQAMIEEMKRGLTAQEAIHEVTAHIPDYRVPTRVLGSRTAKTTLTNHNITMFFPYHYGIFKSYANTVREIASFAPRGGRQEGGFKGRAATSARGIDKLIMAGVIMFLIYPELDKLAQKVTGSADSILRRAGPFTFPYAIYSMLQGKKTIPATASVVLPIPPGTKGAVQMIRNRDDLNRQIWNPSDAYKNPMQAIKDVGKFALGTVAPLSQAQKISSGAANIAQFAEGLVGIQTPNPTKTLVNKLLSQQLNTGVESKAQQRINDQKNAARDQIAKGQGDSLAKKLVDQGVINKKKLKQFEATAKWTSTQRAFDALTPQKKLQVLQKTKPADWPKLGDINAIRDAASKSAGGKRVGAVNKLADNNLVKYIDSKH